MRWGGGGRLKERERVGAGRTEKGGGGWERERLTEKKERGGGGGGVRERHGGREAGCRKAWELGGGRSGGGGGKGGGADGDRPRQETERAEAN